MDMQNGILFFLSAPSLRQQTEEEQVVPADGAGSDMAICLSSARKWEIELGLSYAEPLYSYMW